MVLRILHPILASTLCAANPLARIAERRCCTALAGERNPPMVVAEVCSSMKYPKRCQYKHAKQKKYHVRNWAEIQRRAAPPGRFDSLV